MTRIERIETTALTMGGPAYDRNQVHLTGPGLGITGWATAPST